MHGNEIFRPPDMTCWW